MLSFQDSTNISGTTRLCPVQLLPGQQETPDRERDGYDFLSDCSVPPTSTWLENIRLHFLELQRGRARGGNETCVCVCAHVCGVEMRPREILSLSKVIDSFVIAVSHWLTVPLCHCRCQRFWHLTGLTGPGHLSVIVSPSPVPPCKIKLKMAGLGAAFPSPHNAACYLLAAGLAWLAGNAGVQKPLSHTSPADLWFQTSSSLKR